MTTHVKDTSTEQVDQKEKVGKGHQTQCTVVVHIPEKEAGTTRTVRLLPQRDSGKKSS